MSIDLLAHRGDAAKGARVVANHARSSVTLLWPALDDVACS